jgi:hypothetical protein
MLEHKMLQSVKNHKNVSYYDDNILYLTCVYLSENDEKIKRKHP